MTIHLVFFLEERSAKELLSVFLPRILPENVIYNCIVFNGKQDLEKQLVRKLKLYRVPNTKFLILRDKDSANCLVIKKRLTDLCKQAGKSDHSLVRIACYELESWYLADLAAIENGLGIKNLISFQEKDKFRCPDILPNPARELENLTKFQYEKTSSSSLIGKYLNPDNTRSPSFKFFIQGIRKLIGETI